MEVNLRPALPQYRDYRIYLRALFESKRKSNARFSFRRFSQVVGFRSPNYLQMILDGQRNLTVSTAALIAGKLKLTSGEKDYFVALVQSSAAKNEKERLEAERVRLVALKKIVAKDIPTAQKEVFSKWYYLLVRELFLLPEAKPDLKWITERLSNCITEEEADKALKMLVQAGFLEAAGDSYRAIDPVLDTDDQLMQAAYLRNFHSDTLKVWSQNLERLAPSEQELGVLNIPINSKKLPELRRMIRQFQDEIIGFVQDEKAADCVVQLGTYLVPFSKDEK